MSGLYHFRTNETFHMMKKTIRNKTRPEPLSIYLALIVQDFFFGVVKHRSVQSCSFNLLAEPD